MATNNAVNTSLSGSTGTGSFVGSASPTLTGTPVIPSPFSLGGTSMTATGTNLNLLSGAAQTVVQRVGNITGAVATGSTVLPRDDTIPQSNEGDQYMTQAITPKNASNILRIDITAYLSSGVATPTNMTAALFQDSTANALAAGQFVSVTAGYLNAVTFSYTMAAGTTSATTFKVRAGASDAGTTTFNGTGGGRQLGGVLASSMIVTEYTP